MTQTDTPDRLFSGVYPTGTVYADRTVEKDGDYKRLAFFSFSNHNLEIEDDCPEELKDRIIRDAASIQIRRGEQFPISTAGQYIELGYALD